MWRYIRFVGLGDDVPTRRWSEVINQSFGDNARKKLPARHAKLRLVDQRFLLVADNGHSEITESIDVGWSYDRRKW